MAHNLTISDDKKYIIMKATGDLTNEIADEQMTDLYRLAKEVGIKNFLIDLVECRFIGSTIQQYEYASNDVLDYGYVDRGDRFAFLVHPHDHSHDFIETVSRNSGFDVTLFRDRTKAINHLLE